MRGWEVVAFTVALGKPSDDPAKSLLGWRDVPGISAAAIKAALEWMPDEATPDEVTSDSDKVTSGKATLTDAQNRAKALAMLLAVRPLSSSDWLSLAGVRVATGAPSGQIRSALTMSYLSGPNEDMFILQRGMFGLLQWEALTDTDRRRIIHDLAGAITDDTIPDSGQIKTILGEKSAEVRTQIAAMLEAEQVPSADLARIGF
jgi:hypothetical protein